MRCGVKAAVRAPELSKGAVPRLQCLPGNKADRLRTQAKRLAGVSAAQELSLLESRLAMCRRYSGNCKVKCRAAKLVVAPEPAYPGLRV